MNNVGSVLRGAREEKHQSLKQISAQTRIKEKFLIALENCDWQNLPDFAITQGFAQSYAHAVGANSRLVAALLRRDYSITQKRNRFSEISLERPSIWTPKMTILVVVGGTLLILSYYLFNQYLLFAVSPDLEIEKVESKEQTVLVVGKTTPTATVEINNRPVLVDSQGNFTVEIEKTDLINSQVEIQSTSRTGKTTIVKKDVPN